MAARQSELKDKSHGLAHLLALALNGRREMEGEEVVVLTQVSRPTIGGSSRFWSHSPAESSSHEQSFFNHVDSQKGIGPEIRRGSTTGTVLT